MDSPDRSTEGVKEDDGTPIVEKQDLDSFEDKDEQRDFSSTHGSDVLNEGMQVYLNEEYPLSLKQHSGADNDAPQSLTTRSNLMQLSSPAKNCEDSSLPFGSDLNHNGGRRISDYSSEGLEEIPARDYQSNNLKEEMEGADHVSLPGEFQTEYSYSLPHDTLMAGDNNKFYEAIDGQPSNHYNGGSPTLDETANGGLDSTSANFHSEKAEIDVEMDGTNSNSHNEMKDNDYPSVVASENGGMVWENSSLHSPQRDQNASPSPERQFSISAERSPHSQPSSPIHPSSRQKELPSPTYRDKKLEPSPSPSRKKRSPSPEKHDVIQKRASSRDRSSPPRQKSPSGKTTHRDSCHRDNSPRRRVSASPRRRDSPRRRGRTTSRSPVRRRDSPGNRRDVCRRSRSRSPFARDRSRRSPRRRHSPRRRSPPPSYSRRRSPRRPWSPPANRNNGLGKPGNNLFVAGFSYATTERDLEKKFSRFGRVTDVRIVRDRRSGESRGFGFLSLDKDENADAAIRAIDQTEWNGRILLVEKSKTSTR
ncbi:peptidyl-prolyl cis-trans isomerase CYP63-like isoform X1 [Iris pallida]|uniref:Peptidyl-prolyl cis-trans isomerase CYP63-like isoform X1 n=1 Tax=Iris pallida TaxID=29817 RepID=A0AAX6E0I7_IRIPA|nr:peptidyl-prolyl cis-trans isomerase CYP63-like isoform X1 [Iris pallida]